MKQKSTNPLLSFSAIAFTVLAGHASAATTLIDKTFDGNDTNDIGHAFQPFTNGTGTGGAGDPNTGVIATGSNVNSTRGLNNVSRTTVPLGTTSLVATFVVTSAPASVSTLAANGLFFGIVADTAATAIDGTAIYPNGVRAFGYVAGSVNVEGHSVIQDLNLATATVDFDLPDAPNNASFADGFTVTLTINSNDTWSIVTTGLSTNATGTGGYAGVLNTNSGVGGFDFDTFITDGIGLNASLQSNAQSVTISQMTLTAIPEPSSAMLVGAVGALALLRRRR